MFCEVNVKHYELNWFMVIMHSIKGNIKMFSKMSIYISTADDHIDMLMSDFETSGYIDLINTSFLCHYISTKKCSFSR